MKFQKIEGLPRKLMISVLFFDFVVKYFYANKKIIVLIFFLFFCQALDVGVKTSPAERRVCTKSFPLKRFYRKANRFCAKALLTDLASFQECFPCVSLLWSHFPVKNFWFQKLKKILKKSQK